MSQYDSWKLGLDEPDTPDCGECGDVGCHICEDYPNITCSHNERAAKTGMCQECMEEFDEDPDGWMRYGSHKEGEANWLALLEEMGDCRYEVPNGIDIPF